MARPRKPVGLGLNGSLLGAESIGRAIALFELISKDRFFPGYVKGAATWPLTVVKSY